MTLCVFMYKKIFSGTYNDIGTLGEIMLIFIIGNKRGIALQFPAIILIFIVIQVFMTNSHWDCVEWRGSFCVLAVFIAMKEGRFINNLLRRKRVTSALVQESNKDHLCLVDRVHFCPAGLDGLSTRALWVLSCAQNAVDLFFFQWLLPDIQIRNAVKCHSYHLEYFALLTI